MSSQFVTMPCSMGYLRVRIPLLLWASSPTYESFWPIPTITPWCLGRPTMEGNTARGASSPAKPALHIPEPLSTTRAAMSSSAILRGKSARYKPWWCSLFSSVDLTNRCWRLGFMQLGWEESSRVALWRWLIHLRSRAAVAMESLNSHKCIFVCVWTIPLQIKTTDDPLATITVKFVWRDELLIKSYWLVKVVHSLYL